MLQLLLYLCSDEPDMPKIEYPRKRKMLSGHVRLPEEPRVWDVGSESPISFATLGTERFHIVLATKANQVRMPVHACMCVQHIGIPTGQARMMLSSRKENL